MQETLKSLTVQVLWDNPDVHQNQELADLVFAAVPEYLHGVYLRQALTYTTPVFAAGVRNSKESEVMQETPSRSGKSARPGFRAQGAASWFEEKRNSRLGIPHQGSIPFRLCSMDQLELYTEQMIANGQAQIDKGNRWQDALKIAQDRGYQTGEDFPEELLREIFD